MARGDHLKGRKCPGSGRKKGVGNKTTSDIREMIKGALEDVGGRDYLARQAKENPAPFMALIGKIIPKEVDATLRGANGESLFPTKIILVDGGPRKDD